MNWITLRILALKGRGRGADHHRTGGVTSSTARPRSEVPSLKAENAIDPGKAVGVHQRGLGEAVIGRALRQQRHQRHRVIGQRRQLRRAPCRRCRDTWLDESVIGIGRGRGEPAALQTSFPVRCAASSHKSGAQQLDLVACLAPSKDSVGAMARSITAALRDQHGVGTALGDGLADGGITRWRWARNARHRPHCAARAPFTASLKALAATSP